MSSLRRRRILVASLPLLPLLLAPAGCKRSSSDDDGEDPERKTESVEREADDGRWYRAVISDDGRDEVPFFLYLPGEGAGEALVKTGPQLLDAQASWEGSADADGSQVTIAYDLYHSAIRAESDGAALRGRYESRSKSWGDAELTFVAEPVDQPDPRARFARPDADEDGDPADASGSWRLEFLGGSGEAMLTVEQDDDVVVGTIHFASGNFVLLAGNVHGTKAKLSAFSGASVYRLDLDVAGDEAHGLWLAGHGFDWEESFLGTRVEDADWEPAVGGDALPTKFTSPELDDPKYEDKAVVVELAGSWCSTCKYAAPVMVDLYERYHADGLEMLTLTYEFTTDEDYNRRQAEEFKREYGLPWDVVPVHGGLEDYAEIMPSGFESLDAGGLPIAIFVGRDRTVRGLHAGFPSPDAGEAHENAVAEYERLTRRIVEEGDGGAP